MSTQPEQRLATAFIDLADILADDFDVVDFLHRLADHAVALLGVDECGAMLFSPHGGVVDATASSERARRVGLAQIELRQGPCWDCSHSGVPITDIPLASGDAVRRWPRFAEIGLAHEIAGIASLPMTVRGRTIGALGLFRTRPAPLDDADLRLGQVLADTAAIAVLNQRGLSEQRMLTEQLQTALDSRVVIEQAKGMLAGRAGIGVDEAFERLRRHARHHQQPLTALAHRVIEDRTELLAGPPA
ncbi:GAF and ANTAR domain-containing protein [Streptomyces sp. cg28]|uniref:GAF and ANTAR domain-containing protein n=1 Tax=Streptomyces sp. cg28 TaxID=3403457 RepID=UPI003B20C573